MKSAFTRFFEDYDVCFPRIARLKDGAYYLNSDGDLAPGSKKGKIDKSTLYLERESAGNDFVTIEVSDSNKADLAILYLTNSGKVFRVKINPNSEEVHKGYKKQVFARLGPQKKGTSQVLDDLPSLMESLADFFGTSVDDVKNLPLYASEYYGTTAVVVDRHKEKKPLLLNPKTFFELFHV